MSNNKDRGEDGYLRLFFNYTFKVLWRAVTTIAFLIVDAFGLVLIFFNLNQPKIPLLLSLSVFVLTIVLSAFLTWRDEVLRVNKLKRKLDKIQDLIPHYNISVTALNSHTIKRKIKEIENELEETRPIAKVEEKQSHTLSPMAEALQSLKRTNFNFPFIGTVETNSEKVERLEDFLHQLTEYSKKIGHVYRIDLRFEASRSDENIEFKIELSDNASLFVEDNYILNNLPQTSARTSMSGYDYASLASVGGVSNPNSLYPYSFSENGDGFSKMTKVNAQRSYNIFDEEVYIESKSDKITVKVTIHSTKMNEPQVIKKELEFTEAKKELQDHDI